MLTRDPAGEASAPAPARVLADSAWPLVELPLVAYPEADRLQQAYVAARLEGRAAQDVLILLEHPPVFTLGRHGGRENLVVDEAFLAREGVGLEASARGGNITYHGPGQLVAYPIVHLARRRMRVGDYVQALEAVMLATAREFRVTAVRDERNAGVWVGRRKLGSVGLCLRHGIAFHGLALNVINDLTPFNWINPCGLAGVRMTSLARETGRHLPMAAVREAFKEAFAAELGVSLRSCPPEAWQAAWEGRRPPPSEEHAHGYP
jgi:lipoyl(octanoyl) transferase